MNDRDILRASVLQIWKAQGCERTLTTCGFSMRPLIQDGCRIAFRPLGSGEVPARGDIVVFEADSGLVAHRVVDIIGRGAECQLVEKGDNRLFSRPIALQHVLGIVTRIQGPTGVHDLRIRPWRVLNRAVGLYLCVLCRLLQAARHRGGSRRSLIGRLARRTLARLIAMPRLFFRLLATSMPGGSSPS